MKKKIKWKNLTIIVLMFLFLTGLFISIYNIIYWRIESNKINNQINEVQDITTIEEVNDTENTEIIKQDKIPKTNPYWEYIKMNLIDVDFEKLKKVNSHTKGWLQVKGTNINYPFVQTDDNKYYLTHDFEKKYNDAGWVFLDYRNKLDGNDKNTIIYAHGRKNNTMFGSLKNILKNGWLNDTDNYVLKTSTEHANSLWQVFSVYKIPTTNDYLQTVFNNNLEFLEFVNVLKNRSDYNFNTNLNELDQIITLSTCDGFYDKVVLHAKLIKKELH